MAITVGSYTTDQIHAALQDSRRRWTFRYDLINKDNVFRRNIKVSSATVEHNALADKSKRTAQFLIPAEETPDIGYTDKLRCFALLQMPDEKWAEFCVGTFQLATNGKRYDNKRRMVDPKNQHLGTISEPSVQVMSLTGYDDLLTLAEDAVLDRYVLPAGSNYRTQVIFLLTSVGVPFNNHMIESSSATLPGDMEWPPGTSKLSIINALLGAINYDSLRMTPMGVPASGLYQSPANAAPMFEYKVDRSSVIIPGIDTEIDLFNVPNTWVSYVSEPDRPTLRSVRINSDPASLTSTFARGRQIVQVVEPEQDIWGTDDAPLEQAASQAILDDKVKRIAEESTNIFESAKFATSLMPIHDHADVCYLNYGQGRLKFREVSWTMELKAGGVMQHEFRRAVSV